MKLIDADAFMRFTHEQLSLDETFDADDIWKMIAEQPTIEAQPVVHGEWENECRCSECGQFDWAKPNFCPNCGAKMEGKKV